MTGLIVEASLRFLIVLVLAGVALAAARDWLGR